MTLSGDVVFWAALGSAWAFALLAGMIYLCS
jgi:hypothetical protein